MILSKVGQVSSLKRLHGRRWRGRGVAVRWEPNRLPPRAIYGSRCWLLRYAIDDNVYMITFFRLATLVEVWGQRPLSSFQSDLQHQIKSRTEKQCTRCQPIEKSSDVDVSMYTINILLKVCPLSCVFRSSSIFLLRMVRFRWNSLCYAAASYPLDCLSLAVHEMKSFHGFSCLWILSRGYQHGRVVTLRWGLNHHLPYWQ